MIEQGISRRSFIKGGAIVAAAGGFTLAGCSAPAQTTADAAPKSNVLPDAWDRETDVVVVGSGSIISAALRASDQGLDVLVLEKHPTWFGGTTALSGGCVTCPNSTGNLEKGAPEIPRDLLKDYFMSVSEGQSSEELIDMMLDNYAPAIDYLGEECGYEWQPQGAQEHMGFNIYYPYPEYEEKYSSSPGHVAIGSHKGSGAASGRALPQFAMDALDERGVEVLMGTPATRLIYSGSPNLGDGEVVGVWAESPEGPIAIKARYAVVLGTGGFDHNRDMVKHYINHPIYTTCTIETNTGDGHIMAMELGANMHNMNEAFFQTFNMLGQPDRYLSADLSLDDGTTWSEQQNIQWNPGRTGSIIVNRHGERFTCEGASYDLFGRCWDTYDTGRREWRNIPGYFICDSTYEGGFGNHMPALSKMVEAGEIPEWAHVFDTMEELADGMGIDKEKLLATVERWNTMCEEGIDRDWNRGVGTWDQNTLGNASRVESGELKNPCMAPLKEGPFYCVELYPGMLQTSGGMEINGNAQVKNVRGEIIPRLYAGSNCIANVMGRGYPLGGTPLANGFIVGYVAANHIATLQPWEEKKEA